ncbi:MAG TPA: glycosyltransferase N-terminal domain-containing protein [Ignavibacteria bacterium]|nr:glycosyltransferase N-terminal domain-containing protein [Ignavibacteria bacterium]
MRFLWYVIYNLAGVPFIYVFFKVYSVFNSKVREGFKGRRDLFSELDRSLSLLKQNSNNKKTIVIHSSSLGEYQQALPLVDELRKKNYNIILTFFSPSGFNNSKINLPGVIKSYLPLDSNSNAKKFLDIADPEIVIFMRYDLWYNLIYQSKKRGIKTVLANTRFDENDKTWSIPIVSSFKKTMYRMVDIIFVIDEFDETNYRKKLSDESIEIIKTGDSKFERVYQSAKNINANDILPENIIKDKKIFVMGSSWKDDEDVILPGIDKTLHYDKSLMTILVPHEPKETKISAIEKIIEDKYHNIRSIRYSRINNYKNENFIIIDKIGILSKLYSVAYLSYVGGGFRSGLHNILEPAIFNMPILFSNIVKNSDEDEILIKSGCGILITDTKQFYRVFRSLLKDKKLRDKTGEKCKSVFKDSIGIAEKIVNKITG